MSFKLRDDIKTFILIPALFLSYDFLLPWMVAYFSIALLSITFFRPWKILAYINFAATYFIFKTVGFFIIPETMVPNLSVFLVSQLLLNKHAKRNEFYLVFLWLGSFALFTSSFYYISYAILSLLIVFIIDETQSSLSLKSLFLSLWRYKNQFFFITVLTVVFFIFFPRFYQFLPTANFIPQGKIGYNKEVNNSTTANLQLSSQVAFYAELSTILPPEALYWRGRVLEHTDGYNWKSVSQIFQKIEYTKPTRTIEQIIKFEQDFDGDIILLNTPMDVKTSNLALYKDQMNFTFKGYSKKKKAVIEASSAPNGLANLSLREKNKEKYLQLPNFKPKEVQAFFNEIDSPKLEEFISRFKRKIIKDNYSYTLSPGQLTTISDFIRAKKGYCSHFASLFGILLRMKGVPTRLVSGFQGGELNQMGKFYLIKSNDAHVWVEYYANKQWNTIDPTGFVAPDRVNLGGSQYLSVGVSRAIEENRSYASVAYYSIKGFFDNLNYRVSLFLDNFDRNKQKSLSESLNLTRKAFYILGFFIFLIISAIIYLLNRPKHKAYYHPLDKLLYKFGKKHKIDIFKENTIKGLKAHSDRFENSEDYLHAIELYQRARYGQEDLYQDIKQILARLEHAKN